MNQQYTDLLEEIYPSFFKKWNRVRFAKVCIRLVNFETYNFSQKDICKMVRKSPHLLNLTTERTNRLLANLELYGFSQEDVRKMVKKSPSILDCTTERTNRLLANLELYGLSQEDVRNIVKKHSTILGYSTERTNGLLANLELYGFTRADVRIIVMKSPSILDCTTERTNGLLANLELYDLSQEDVRQTVKKFPAILCCSAMRTGQCIDIFQKIGRSVVDGGMDFMFSPSLLRGRIVFLKRQGQELPHKMLFTNNATWQKRFGTMRAEIVALDPGHDVFMR